MAKTPQEWSQMAMAMNESMRTLVQNSIIERYPQYTEKEVIAKLFRRYYMNDFPPEKMAEIMEQIRKI